MPTRIRGPCAFEKCPADKTEELDAEVCSSATCTRLVHHFCSNELLDGELAARVCSRSCLQALRAASAVPSTRTTDQAKAPSRWKAAAALASYCRQSKKAPHPGVDLGTARSGKARSVSAVAADATRRPLGLTTSRKKPQRLRPSTIASKTGSTEASLATKVHGDDVSGIPPSFSLASSITNPRAGVDAFGAGGSYDDESSRVSFGDDSESSDLAAASDSDVDEGSADIDSSIPLVNRKKNNQKKFFFTQTANLALLQEMLAVEPYAAPHGQIGKRYQEVADNLSSHFNVVPKLSSRTVRDHFKLLVEEFYQHDNSYRKKSGAKEDYNKHRQLLQDITDRMREVSAAKKTARSKKKDKETRLQTQGEILREKAVKRRSQRSDDAEEEQLTGPGNDDKTASASTSEASTSTTSKSSPQNGSLGSYLEIQALNRHEDTTLQRSMVELKKRKVEAEESRWEKEFEFKRLKHTLDEKKWNDEVDLRRQELQVRREEIALMKMQFQMLQDRSGHEPVRRSD